MRGPMPSVMLDRAVTVSMGFAEMTYASYPMEAKMFCSNVQDRPSVAYMRLSTRICEGTIDLANPSHDERSSGPVGAIMCEKATAINREFISNWCCVVSISAHKSVH